MSERKNKGIKEALKRIHEVVEEVHDEMGPPERKRGNDIHAQVNFARMVGDKIAELFEDDELVKSFRVGSRLIWELAESRILLLDREKGDEK